MRYTETERGHTLIIFLIFTFVIGIVFVMLFGSKEYATTGGDLQPMTASGTAPETRLEAYRADMDAAHGAADMSQQQVYKLEEFEE
jgi:hypothetical protein